MHSQRVCEEHLAQTLDLACIITLPPFRERSDADLWHKIWRNEVRKDDRVERIDHRTARYREALGLGLNQGPRSFSLGTSKSKLAIFIFELQVMMARFLNLLGLVLSLYALAQAHGSHSAQDAGETDWAVCLLPQRAGGP